MALKWNRNGIFGSSQTFAHEIGVARRIPSFRADGDNGFKMLQKSVSRSRVHSGADNDCQISEESLLIDVIPFGIAFFHQTFSLKEVHVSALAEAHGMPEGYCERYSQQRTKASISEFKRLSRTLFRHVSTLLFGGFVTVGKDQAGLLAWHSLSPSAHPEVKGTICSLQ